MSSAQNQVKGKPTLNKNPVKQVPKQQKGPVAMVKNNGQNKNLQVMPPRTDRKSVV